MASYHNHSALAWIAWAKEDIRRTGNTRMLLDQVEDDGVVGALNILCKKQRNASPPDQWTDGLFTIKMWYYNDLVSYSVSVNAPIT